MPALNSLKFNQPASDLDPDDKIHLDPDDKIHGWFQLAECSHNVPVPLALPQQHMPGREPGLIPATSATSCPVQCERKYTGPLSSEMKYPDIHSAPHGGTTRASYRRTRHDSLGTGSRTAVDRELYRVPAAATVNFSAGGSLRRQSNDAGRPLGSGRAGKPVPPASDYGQRRAWTAACELEYRV